jgi:sugar transferase (PEP-CTERM/EpsH1 system associated)
VKIHIAHILYSFGAGGLENTLASLINSMDCDRFSHSIYTFCDEFETFKKITLKDVDKIAVKRAFPNDPTVVFRLAGAIKRKKPDIVKTYNWSGTDGIIAAKLVGVKHIIHSEHGFDLEEMHKQKIRRILTRRFLFNFCCKIIVVSKTLERYAVDIVKTDKNKIAYIPNGCDTSVFYPGRDLEKRKELGIAEKDIVIGAVGSLKPIKGQEVLIKAFAGLQGFFSPSKRTAKLLIVGDGQDRQRLELLTENLGIKDKVIFEGIVNSPASFYRAMDIFVMPSLSENCPNALLEAMATGLPIIATDVGDIRFMLDGEKGGIIVGVNNVSAIADAVENLISDPLIARGKRDFALKRLKEQFTLDKAIVAYHNIYESCLKLQNNHSEKTWV